MWDFLNSLTENILNWYRENSQIPIREYNPVKDATDTCIALEKALEIKSSEIWILGATGSRIDHVLCNIHILKRSWLAGVPAYLADSHNQISLPVDNPFTIKREEQLEPMCPFSSGRRGGRADTYRF